MHFINADTASMAAGFDGASVRENMLPPANIHRALHGLLQGEPQPALLPLLTSKQAPCVQRTCDILDLYNLLTETNAACSHILAQSGLTSTADSASSGGVQSDAESSLRRPQHNSAYAELARTALQEGAQKLVLAMVDRVSNHE